MSLKAEKGLKQRRREQCKDRAKSESTETATFA